MAENWGYAVIRDEFNALMSEISETMAGRPIDDALTDHLNATYPPSGGTFRRMKALCQAAIDEGWMCADGSGNRRFGRVTEPDAPDQRHECRRRCAGYRRRPPS